MRFERLELASFRAFDRLSLDPAPGLNVLAGSNATGKTSVLEALSVLATGRSFRGASDQEMLRFTFGRYRLAGRVGGRLASRTIEIVFTAGGDGVPSQKTWSVDGHSLERASELLGQVPLLSFSPDDLALVKGGPAERRRYLDLLLGQFSPAYRVHLARYQRLLAQRNALLADLAARRIGAEAARTVLEAWDESLAGEADAVQEARGEMADSLAPLAAAAFADMDGGEVALSYQRDAFDPARRLEELRRGLTLSGPHRDELALIVQGREARHFASQGQQRSLVLALKLAAFQILEAQVGEKPVLLLDDVMSELDPRRGAALLPLLGRGQVFLTTTDRPTLERAFSWGPFPAGPAGIGAWFQVEGGTVAREGASGNESDRG